MNMKRKNHAVYLTQGAVIAALYVLLTWLSSLFGLSSGVIQLRISEALCVLPVFFPSAIPGLYVGCILANLLTGAAPWDVVFGSLATLIGAFGAYFIGKAARGRVRWLSCLAPLPTVAANALIVPLVLIYTYGATEAFSFLVFTVGLGELISAWGFGILLLMALKRIYK